MKSFYQKLFFGQTKVSVC